MLNKEVLLTGTLGRKPESEFTPQGKQITKFSIAVNIGWGDDKRTEWYDCVAWEKTAETLYQYLDKGSRIQVRGNFELQCWIAKKGQNAGEPQAKLVVTVRDFQFLSAKKEREDTDEDEDAPEFMRY